MKRATWSVVTSAALSLAVLGCGSSSSNPSGASSSQVVQGRASGDSPVTSVALKASGSPSALTATPADGGEFSFDVAALPAPYRLKAESASGALYAVATKPGVTNVNEITTVVAAASSADGDAETSWAGRDSGSSDDIERILKSLTTVLKPLFDLYGVTRIDDDDPAVRALLKDVSFIVKGRQVTVKNRATGAVIFTGPLRDLASGTFTPANMPAGPVGTTPSTCASFTYSAWGACQADGTQTRTVATSSPAGCTGGTPVTSQSCTYVPPGPAACQYTYSAWGACQPNGTQTRTVLTSGPAGCTGTPVTSQSCTYVPPAPTCSSFTYSAWGSLPAEQHPDADRAHLVPDGLHGRHAGHLAVVHLRAAGDDLHLVHLLGLGHLPAEQHPDADRAHVVPDGLHGRHAGHIPVLHLRAAGDDLHLVHLLGLGHLPAEQHPDADRAHLVPDGLHGRYAGHLPGLHLHRTLHAGDGSRQSAAPATAFPGTASHNQSVKTCATCHGPVNNGTGTPSTGMTASLNSSGVCVLTIRPTGRTTTAWSTAAQPSDPRLASRGAVHTGHPVLRDAVPRLLWVASAPAMGHATTSNAAGGEAFAPVLRATPGEKKKAGDSSKNPEESPASGMERETGFEPATLSLGS